MLQAAGIEKPAHNAEFGDKAVTRLDACEIKDLPSPAKEREYQESPKPQYTPEEPELHQWLKKARRTLSQASVSKKRQSFRKDQSKTNDSLRSLTNPTAVQSPVRLYIDHIIRAISEIRIFCNMSRRSTNDREEMPALGETTRSRRNKGGLRDKLRAEMVLKQRTDLSFIPEGVLKELITKNDVQTALRKHRLSSDISKVADFVCDKAIRLFAILVWNESEILIEQFYKFDFGDQNLPVEVDIDDDNDYVEASTFVSGKSIVIKKHPFNFDPWTDRVLNYFCDFEQWCFLSPVFNDGVFRYHFHKRHRIPFVDLRPGVTKETNFSIVEERRIHRRHLQVRNIGPPLATPAPPCSSHK